MAHQHWKNFEHNALPKGLNNWRVIKLKPQGLYFLLMMEELSTWAPVDIMFPFLIDMLLPPKRLVCKTNSTELYMGMHKHASLFHTLKKCLQPTAQTLHQGNGILKLLGIVQIQYSSYIKNLPYFFPNHFAIPNHFLWFSQPCKEQGNWHSSCTTGKTIHLLCLQRLQEARSHICPFILFIRFFVISHLRDLVVT